MIMEDLCRKIPLIRQSIFKELDDQSFVNFKDASREISNPLRKERFYWIRVLRKYNYLMRDFKDYWAKAIKKTSAEFVKQIVILIDPFLKYQFIYDRYHAMLKGFFSPHHIAACSGKLDFYKHFVERTGDLNPKEEISELTTLHFAACNGKFEVLEIKPCGLFSRIRDVCSPKIYYK